MKIYQKNSILLLIAVIVVVVASMVYLLTGGNPTVQQQPTVSAVVTSAPRSTSVPLSPQATPNTVKPCSAKHRNFQMGIAFPDWGTTAYGVSDTKWNLELPDMQLQTAACWLQMPVLLHQNNLTSTMVVQGSATTQLSSLDYGIRAAHLLGLHVFVAMQLQVAGDQPWSGAIYFASYQQEQQWFDSYFQTLKPYITLAEKDGVEQFAFGTEYAWLEQNAPASLWNELISKLSSIYHGSLTYDMNWGSLKTPPPSWMQNQHLNMIGVSAYSPLVSTPQHVAPSQVSALWQKTVKQDLDNFSLALGRPIFISEIGYPNGANALYRPWQSTGNGAPDPQEQAAACDAALANVIGDKHILGIFFWGWDNTEDFDLNGKQATSVIHSYYQSLQTNNN